MAFPGVLSPIGNVWRCIADALEEAGTLEPELNLRVSDARPPNFNCEPMRNFPRQSPLQIGAKLDAVEPLAFEVGAQGDGKLMFFSIEILWDGTDPASISTVFTPSFIRDPLGPKGWDALFETMLTRWASWGAWRFDDHYLDWQSASEASDVYEECYGVLPPGYRIWSEPSGSPWLSPKRRIDISLNPGRPYMLAPGVSFYATAEMWLGPHFWQHAKCSKDEALAAPFWLETRDTPQFTYFRFWPSAFTRPDGEQGRMQQRLWKLFFHEDCAWPPGSRMISEDPMYGPKKLWPADLVYPY